MIKQSVSGVSGKKVSEAVAVSSVEHVGTAAARGGGSRPRRECDSGNPAARAWRARTPAAFLSARVDPSARLASVVARDESSAAVLTLGGS